jgi:uncharacterized repeat protein (TIGR01451 family)
MIHRRAVPVLLLTVLVLLTAPAAQAQVSLTTLGTPYTQSFDTLPASGSATWTNNSTIPGWFHARTGTGTTIIAGSGSSGTGGLYSFGTGTATERALGSVGSGGAAAGNMFWGVRLQNNTGSTITSLDITYTGEQWRQGGCSGAGCTPAAQTIVFSYLVGSPTVTGSLAEFQSAGVAVSALDFTSPNPGATATPAALDGNLAANQTTKSFSITGLNVPNGTEIMLRWSDPDHPNNDHGLSVDDFAVTPQGAAPNPPVVPTCPATVSTPSGTPTSAPVSATDANGTVTAATITGITPSDPGTITLINFVPAGGPGGTATATLDVSNATPAGSYNVTIQWSNNDGVPQTATCSVTVNVTAPVVIAFIHDIQGNGTASPLVGQTVSARGIVTLLKSNGFFLQEELADYDADPNTSEGIFVFTSSAPSVAVGDDATVTGTVVEFNGLTEISPVSNVTINSAGNTLPAAITLTLADLPSSANFTQPQLEKYESMRLVAPSLTTVAPNDTFFDVYTVLASQPRPVREPGIPAADPIPPDPTTGLPDCCIPIWDMNPERLSVDTNGRAGSTGETLTSNVTLTNVAGPLDFSFGEYRLINEANLTRTADMSAVPVPTPAANEFTVAGYNIENFNNNATQRQKAALTVRDVLILPDIIGTVEIFDLADLQALATEIQTISGVAYSAHLIEQDGTSEDSDQDVGFLVKTSRVSVTSVTAERAADTFINPNTGLPETLHDRPPLVLRGTVDPSGPNPLPVIVVVNHTRSFIDIELVAGEGVRVRAKRKAQAESLADLLNDLQTDNPGTPVIWVGDYNAFQFNNGYDDLISVLKGMPTPDDQIVVDQSPDLVNPDAYNLIEDVPGAQRYTFLFEGTPQALDHMLVNPLALALNTGIAVARVNADFPEASAAVYASNAARPERNSDHDPVVGYFVFPSADVALTKTLDTAGPHFEGQSVTYTINVANSGPVAATNISVTDTPTNLTITGVSGACASLPCTIASLAAGANTNITVNATINAVGAFDNSASADADEADPNTANNTDNTGNGGTAGATANVSVSKTLDTAGPYYHGGSVTYTLTVANAGPSTATSISVTDTPSNMTITGVSGACASFSPCTIASLASGANTIITVTATINGAGAFDNSATATATEHDPNTSDNTDNTGNGGTAAAQADVSLTKTLDTAGPWNVGQSITYTIVVSNSGPSTATTLNVTDSPSNLTITGVSGACASFSPCTIAALASGASTNITVTATIDSVGSFDNSATALAAENDPNTTDNTDSTGNGGSTNAAADVTMNVTLNNSSPYFAGSAVTFILDSGNTGPSTATNVQVTAALTNLTVISVSGGGCTALPCTLPTITTGGNVQVFVNATIDAAGDFGISGSANGAEFDPTASNNTDNDGDTATLSADVSIVKTLITTPPHNVGQSITYTLDVANAGPSIATTVQVTDTPTNLTITSVSGGGCSALPCTIASIASGASVQITVTATINSVGAFDNSASATGAEPDPNLANNTDNTGNGGTTGNAADVSVAKSIVTPGPYHQGDTVQFQTVVSNAGPNTATNLVVTDTPNGVSLVAGSISGAGCTAFPCTIPTLAAGAGDTITYSGTIQNPGSFDNGATVTAAEFDPNTANNSDPSGNGGVAQNTVNVAITKTLDTPGPYVAGQSVTYTLVVSNTGPGVASPVVVSDTPTGLTITSVSGAGCTALPCTLGPSITPTPASNRTITVVATIDGVGAFDNSATATPDPVDYDPDLSNNTDNTGNGGTAGAILDTDGDGVADGVEQAAPNGGDGNGDGIPDHTQSTVASLPAATGSGYLTLQSSCALQEVYVTTESAMPSDDPAFEYPHGMIAFRAPCSSATFSLFVYGSGAVSSYRKYGPLPPGGPSQWYGLPGASFQVVTVGSLHPRRIDFSLTDGGTGDDTVVDGVIVDQGGPADPTANIPTLDEWALLALAMVIAAFAALKLRS